ncbi:hypothetical protein [Streptomyces sp. CoH17]|uniref:hypothetical protein n=1 Tax=Streptomyces sp. CoH17 TaxID=2992806 RepID=UPI0022716B9F|nr:hypothetical protein [Streptomyces sp. CoH17]
MPHDPYAVLRALLRAEAARRTPHPAPRRKHPANSGSPRGSTGAADAPLHEGGGVAEAVVRLSVTPGRPPWGPI